NSTSTMAKKVTKVSELKTTPHPAVGQVRAPRTPRTAALPRLGAGGPPRNVKHIGGRRDTSNTGVIGASPKTTHAAQSPEVPPAGGVGQRPEQQVQGGGRRKSITLR